MSKITKSQENKINELLNKHNLSYKKGFHKNDVYYIVNSDEVNKSIYDIKTHRMLQKNKKDLYEILMMWQEFIPERLQEIKSKISKD